MAKPGSLMMSISIFTLMAFMKILPLMINSGPSGAAAATAITGDFTKVLQGMKATAPCQMKIFT
jgi:hypothetical protein